jgi:hypothetical protein
MHYLILQGSFFLMLQSVDRRHLYIIQRDTIFFVCAVKLEIHLNSFTDEYDDPGFCKFPPLLTSPVVTDRHANNVLSPRSQWNVPSAQYAPKHTHRVYFMCLMFSALCHA